MHCRGMLSISPYICAQLSGTQFAIEVCLRKLLLVSPSSMLQFVYMHQ